MRKTVRVSRTIQIWDKYLQKYYKKEAHHLVHDPNDILNEGDVITYGPFPPSIRRDREKKGRIGGKKLVKYMVREVITPFGQQVEQRTRRVVGSQDGRWKGGPGEVKKIAMRARRKGKGKLEAPLLKNDEEKAAHTQAEPV
ncbi:uncharacterized protein Z518_10012 [Rhinocladiella mackenziei CBS 650.93]|uniref:Uncharacterized protein n=1 Tax=Rhinocladiella mackenziei CBS 650.93 TaxID=1442369 RepID=A0A0D2ICG4_9EURO|nr:uncharacterized protein Z518_10012 [Rhinocladiella mackenziei CBS 650.93]KIX00946.1 hypothetical protein Z518_10012 [Rhinocladiella mackenziei CBS 650.93]